MKKTLTAGILAIIAALTALANVETGSAQTPTPTPAPNAHNCLPTSPDDATCLWQLELAKFEVKVEYEYPHCDLKTTLEHNLDELPAGVTPESDRPRLSYVRPGGDAPLWRTGYYQGDTPTVVFHGDRHFYSKLSHGEIRLPWDKFDHTDSQLAATYGRSYSSWQQRTNGNVYASIVVEYDMQSEFASEFARERRVGNNFVHYKSKLPLTFISDPLPISHTFAGLTEEIFTCFEVAKREAKRVDERSALDTEKAGLRQSLVLLEAELARARAHELDATNVLKEVIAISERVEEVRRTIHRVRVEGIAHRRALIERYYAEESERYSVFIKSLEASAAALAASDKAIAAHKAELEASRARLTQIVTAAQEAEAELIAEIENARETLGED